MANTPRASSQCIIIDTDFRTILEHFEKSRTFTWNNRSQVKSGHYYSCIRISDFLFVIMTLNALGVDVIEFQDWEPLGGLLGNTGDNTPRASRHCLPPWVPGLGPPRGGRWPLAELQVCSGCRTWTHQESLALLESLAMRLIETIINTWRNTGKNHLFVDSPTLSWDISYFPRVSVRIILLHYYSGEASRGSLGSRLEGPGS